MMRWIMTIAAVVFVVAQSPAATHYMLPENENAASPYTSWETAGTSLYDVVTAAMAQDEPRLILISNGVYWLTNDFTITKAVTIRSWNNGEVDRDGTILNGQADEGFFSRMRLIDPGIVLDGLTITNSTCRGAGSDLQSGGGINLYAGLVTNCLITGCSAPSGGYGGGGIRVTGTGTVTHCVIRGNRSSSGGGGIGFANASQAIVDNCVIEENIVDNNQNGGGLSFVRPGPTRISNCLIRNNACTNGVCYGGGIFINTLNSETNLLIANCTIVSNSCLHSGGGICFTASASKTNIVLNCIISGNAKSQVNDIAKSNYYAVAYSCGEGSAYFLAEHTGNLITDPCFVDFEGQDFHLKRESPCLDAGTNLDWMVGASDLDGRSRLDRFTRRVDMGCYEFLWQGTVLFSP